MAEIWQKAEGKPLIRGLFQFIEALQVQNSEMQDSPPYPNQSIRSRQTDRTLYFPFFRIKKVVIQRQLLVSWGIMDEFIMVFSWRSKKFTSASED